MVNATSIESAQTDSNQTSIICIDSSETKSYHISRKTFLLGNQRSFEWIMTAHQHCVWIATAVTKQSINSPINTAPERISSAAAVSPTDRWRNKVLSEQTGVQLYLINLGKVKASIITGLLLLYFNQFSQLHFVWNEATSSAVKQEFFACYQGSYPPIKEHIIIFTSNPKLTEIRH